MANSPLPSSTCPEHAELDTKIAQCVQSLSDISVRAADLAKKPNYEASELFRMLLTENALVTARLRTLRECLEAHMHTHGCSGSGAHPPASGEWAEESNAN